MTRPERLRRPPTPAGFDPSRAAERAADPAGWRFADADHLRAIDGANTSVCVGSGREAPGQGVGRALHR